MNCGRVHGPTCCLEHFYSDLEWVENVNINLPCIKQRVSLLGSRRTVKKDAQALWLLNAIRCIDLTTLSGDDTPSNCYRLCHKAAHPLRDDFVEKLGIRSCNLTTGAVCVYPARVHDCASYLEKIGSKIPVASVATGFPTGQVKLATRLAEISGAVEDGASEIDVVINRCAALQGNWETVYNEICEMKAACKHAHMKTILATGELGSLTNVHKASLVAMMAGSDFIKTSTGKEGVNAILPVGLVMCRAIQDYYEETGIKVGFKPAGGIRTAKDAITWQILMKEELGSDWLKPNLFRIGASGLLTDIERQLFHYLTGSYAAAHEMPMG